MKKLIAIIGLLSIACTVRGQEKKPMPDAPEAHIFEITRRDNHVEDVGDTKAGPDAMQLNALAPPADDSDRWFINVLTTKDSAWAADCAKLASDFASNINLRAWGDMDNPSESWAHLDFKDTNDPKLKDWFAAIRPQIEGKPYPMIHLQPPRNESFGKNATTIGIIYGYNGDPKALSDRIRAKIKGYADTIAAKQATSGGHGQKSSHPVTDQPSRNPMEWPQISKPMTYGQIKKLVPDAPYVWIQEMVKLGTSSEEQLLEAYDEYLAGEQADRDEVKVDPENPPHWRMSSSEGLVLVVIVLGAVAIVVRDLRKRASTNTSSTNAKPMTPG